MVTGITAGNTNIVLTPNSSTLFLQCIKLLGIF